MDVFAKAAVRDVRPSGLQRIMPGAGGRRLSDRQRRTTSRDIGSMCASDELANAPKHGARCRQPDRDDERGDAGVPCVALRSARLVARGSQHQHGDAPIAGAPLIHGPAWIDLEVPLPQPLPLLADGLM
jgi:hypothetical protein